jgi:hypothetical protein
MKSTLRLKQGEECSENGRFPEVSTDAFTHRHEGPNYFGGSATRHTPLSPLRIAAAPTGRHDDSYRQAPGRIAPGLLEFSGPRPLRNRPAFVGGLAPR